LCYDKNLFQCNIRYKSKNAMCFTVSANTKHFLTKLCFNQYHFKPSKYLDYLCLRGEDV